MADKKISQFTDGGNLADSDVLPIARGASNFKISGDKVIKSQQKDATGGVVGLTLFNINFKNVTNTFTSFFTNSNTAARTYTFQDRNGTIADDTDISGRQPLDSDLTTIAGLTPSDDDFLQRKSGAWANRTIAQVKTDLSLSGTNTGDQTITLTGDVTGSGTGSFAATIAADSVTNAKLANMPANTVKINNTTSPENPTDLVMGNSTFLGRTSSSDIKAMSVSEVKTELGAGSANGLATLDGGGKVPATQLPNTVMELVGSWDASTNTPTLADGVGNPGDIYEVTVGGTQNLGSGNITFIVGDWVVYGSSGVWYKSVNSNSVNSVFGRVGSVVSANGDYTASQITNVASGSISSTTVQAAIDELDSEKQPLDSDLTTIAGLTPTNDDFLQYKSGAWANRTPTQSTADLVNFVGDSGSGGTKGLVPAPVAGDAIKFLKGDGAWSLIGLITVSAKTNGVGSPYIITTADSATRFTNTGATAEVYLNLPAATVGLAYSGRCTDSDLMRFVANGTDTIRDAATVSGAGGYCQLGAVGSSVDLECVESGKWTVVSANGTLNII